MKKIKRAGTVNRGRSIACVFFIFTFAVTTKLVAQSTVSWGDLAVNGVRESISTAQFNPGRYAFDTDASSAWALNPGSTAGWIEKYWSSPQKLLGAYLHVDIPANVTLMLYYDASGIWVPIPGTSVTGKKTYSSTVWFPVTIPETTKILITLEGKDADQARLWNVELINNPSVKAFTKILPKSFTCKQAEFINIKPDRLWDSYIQNPWFEPLWSFPWEVFQTSGQNQPTKIFPPYKGNPPNSGEIIWELDDSYDISLVKAYFKETWRSLAFEFWDGSKWTQKQTFNGNMSKGWNRIALTKPITAKRIRITFPNGWESARFISEIEVWGEGSNGVSSRPLVIPPVAADGSLHFTVTGLQQRDYKLEVTLPGIQTLPITVFLNGESCTGTPLTYQGEDTVYRVIVSGDQIVGDTQFLEIAANEPPIGVVVSEKKDTGRIVLDNPTSDEYINAPLSVETSRTKEKSWVLDRKYELERIKLFCDNVPDLAVKVKTGSKWVDIPLVFSKNESCWSGILSGIEADAIKMSSNTEFAVYEAFVYGSPVMDDSASLEIWWPEKGATVTSPAQDGNSIIGWMGDASTKLSIGKFFPRQADRIFWMPLSQMEFSPGEEKTFSIQGRYGSKDVVKSHKIAWKGNQTIATLDQGTALVSTGEDSIAVSGKLYTNNARCFINDVETSVVNKKFMTTCSLQPGYQTVSIEIWNSNKQKLLTSFTKPVYRLIGSPILALDQPFGDIWTQRDVLTLSGRVGNGIGFHLTVNGVAVDLVDDIFSTTIPLGEGTQSIEFSLLDVAGRVTNKTLMVHRDRTRPVITITNPIEGQYIRSSKVLFNVASEIGEPPLWWQFNTEDWEPGQIGTKNKEYTLADGFYTYTVRAQDRSGNSSDLQSVNFCVDITPPKEFTIQTNVKEWTSNTTPTITFSTTDEVSGFDRYEYTIDNGVWEIVTSPYTLPVLSDGEHEVFVRAIDRAGNVRLSHVPIRIDTSKPTTPRTLRYVPGNNSITMKWEGVDDGESYQRYCIERKPAWGTGVVSVSGKSYGDQEYSDKPLTILDEYEYRIWAIDRADNESDKSEWFAATVGFQSAEVTNTDDTVVEYKDFSMCIPKGSLATDIIRIQLNEAPLDSILNLPTKPLISPIYQVTVLRETSDGTETTLHADLESSATVEISYDINKIPQGYTESNLKPFYYDDLWGRWIPFDDTFIDPQQHVMRFTTDHFTEIAVLATKEMDLSEQQIHSEEYSPLRTSVGPGDVNVSPTGSVSTSFTELVLPGKNGLDLILARTYNTVTAQKDAPETEEKDTKKPADTEDDEVDGDEPWKIAAGWRINLPSMRWNGSNIWVTDLDGKKISVKQMKELRKPTSVSEGNTKQITVYLQSHENYDSSCQLVFNEKKHNSYFLGIIKIGSHTTYSFNHASITMKDGRQAVFNKKGQVTKILDATRKNEIAFHYTDNCIDYITDTIGRKISFAYDQEKKYISSITPSIGAVDGTPIAYTLNEDDTLQTATDIGGREWVYGYSDQLVAWKSVLTNPTDGNKDNTTEKEYTVSLLNEVRGPGIGLTKLTYSKVPKEYEDDIEVTENSYGSKKKKKYIYDITTDHILIQNKEIYIDQQGPLLRTTNYSFEEEFAGNKQFTTKESIVDDGRCITKTYYIPFERDRESLSLAPEALRKTIGYEVGTRVEKNTEYLFRPDSIIKTVDGVTISTEKRVWNETTLRLTSDTVVKYQSKDTSGKIDDTKTIGTSSTFEYDHWGNVTKEEISSKVGTRTSKKVIDQVFYYDELIPEQVAHYENKPINQDSKKYTFPDGFSTKSPSLANDCYHLLASRKVQVYGQRIDGEEDKKPVEEFEVYNYTDFSQLSNKIRYLGNNSWASYKYTYDSITGQVSEVTEPGGSSSVDQVVNYTYDYTPVSYYVITETKKSVVLSIGESRKDIVSKMVYSKLNGMPKWYEDSSDFITAYTYDSLGRLKKKVMPTVNDTCSLDSLPDTDFNRTNNPTLSIEYDDSELKSTVTNTLNGTTLYDFDQLGRLTSVVATTNSTESITTTYGYDEYDQLVKINGPVSSSETVFKLDDIVTRMLYDKRGRIIQKWLPGQTSPKTYTYDDTINQVTEKDELGNLIRRTYDWYGNVLESKIQLGSTKLIGSTMYYDGYNRLIKKVDPENNCTEISYNELGYTSKITRPQRDWIDGADNLKVKPIRTFEYYKNGSVQSYTETYVANNPDKPNVVILPKEGEEIVTTNSVVNGLGWILETTVPVTSGGVAKTLKSTNEYDQRGYVTSIKSGYSDVTPLKGKSWSYDALGNILTMTDEDSKVTTFTYDKAGNRTGIIDPRESVVVPNKTEHVYTGEFTVTMQYDQLNRLVSATLPRKDRSNAEEITNVSMKYDGRGNLIKQVAIDGIVRNYTYNAQNWLVEETLTSSDLAKAYTTKHEYDSIGREIKTTSYTGREIVRFYDEAGRVTQAGSDIEGWMRYTYFDNGTVKEVTDQRGNKSSFTYNPEHQVTSYTDAKPGKPGKHTTSYDWLGRIVETKDAEQNVRVYTYDGIGRLVGETTPTGDKLSFVYDGKGNVKEYKDARGTTFTREYTNTNLLQTEKSTNGSITETLSCVYDEAGALKTVDNGVKTLFNYINGNYQPNAYGANTRTTNTIGSESISMGYEYDSAMRLTQVTMPNASKVGYQYNKIGELIDVTDGPNGVTGWLDGEITYDKGRLTGYKTSSGLEKTIMYDDADRITSLTYSKNSDNVKEYSFGYDEASNIIRKNRNVYTYDELNQLKTSYEYGWFQKQPKDVAPDYGEAERDYTGTASVNYSIKAVDSKDYTVIFDAASKSLACDLLTPLWVNKIELRPSNASHRVKKEDITVYYLAGSGGTPGWVKVEDYDIEKNGDTGAFMVYFHTAIETRYLKVSSIWDDRDVRNTSTLTYATFKNTISDLIQVWTMTTSHTESYEYDAVGNRISLNSDGVASGNEYYKNLNGGHTSRIKKDAEWYYQYDKAGNRITKGKAVTGTGEAIVVNSAKENWTYTWDLHNRLVKVVSSTGVSVSYVYDAQNHRVKRTGKDGTTVYAYGRNGALAYQKNLTTGFERSYTYMGSVILGWTETMNGISKRYYAVTDTLGSVTQIRDADNNLVWDGEYAPFGVMTGAVGEKRFDGMFTGKDIDSETGLTYHWNRWRSEDGTSFISEDPARDGINWYGYALANPLRYTDPTGLGTIDGGGSKTDPNNWTQTDDPTPGGEDDSDGDTSNPTVSQGEDEGSGDGGLAGDGEGDGEGDGTEGPAAPTAPTAPTAPSAPGGPATPGPGPGLNTSGHSNQGTQNPKGLSTGDNPAGLGQDDSSFDGSKILARGLRMLGTPYGHYGEGYTAYMSFDVSNMDCTQFTALANNLPVVGSREYATSPYYTRSDSLKAGMTIVWTAINSKGEPTGHAAIYTGEEGTRALLHSDPKGVRYSSNYLSNHYSDNGYTNITINYYAPK